ncbi:MAG: 4-hydroxy-tetrahydrodipicolinate reductase [Chloroflexi bacterium]|nr:4-hydroxy-tetrahydrodipicolinate reductase [Chloroflexota bacterium]
MRPIKVVVNGALGKVGREVVTTVSHDPETQLVGAVEMKPASAYLTLADDTKVPFSADMESILVNCLPDVLVDFTNRRVAMLAAKNAAQHGVNLVIGTTGLTPEDVQEIGRLATVNKVGAVVAPNFALGAVVMMHLSRIAAKYLDYVEIIELHHNQKADAPSGTALATARLMAQARGKPFSRPPVEKELADSRKELVEGVTIHSVRLPGLMAHQEVLFGAPGQTLSIRHDTINRECYMPGVMLAIKEVVKRQGLIYGLDTLLGLQ